MKKIVLALVVTLLFSFKHPFYMGVTELKYNARERALQGSVKLFTNDLEDALKKLHHETVDLINPADTLKVRRQLDDYLKKRLSFLVNGLPKKYELLGFEQEQEAVWIYIEIKNCPFPKKINIDNRLLYDFIKDQSNIIHVELGLQKQSHKLNNPEAQVEFKF